MTRVHWKESYKWKSYREMTPKLYRVSPLSIQLKYLSVLLYEEITQGQKNHLNGLEVIELATHTELRIVPIPTIQNLLPKENLMIHEELSRIHRRILPQYWIVIRYHIVENWPYTEHCFNPTSKS